MSANPIKVINKIIDVQDRVGAFIAGPDRDGLAGHIQQGYRTRCNQAANIPAWLRNLSSPARETLSNYCQPWYDQQGASGFTAEPPFMGGQCPVFYTLRVESRVFSQSQQQFIWQAGFQFQFRGPLTVTNEPAPGSCPEGTVGPQGWTLRSPNESQARSLFTGCADVSPGYRFIQMFRTDGLPDDCGDPEPELTPGPNPPPDPGPLPGPEPSDDPFGSPFPELPIPDFPGPFGDFPILAPADEPVGVDPDSIPATGGDGLPGLGDAIGAPAGSSEGGEDGEEVDFGAPPSGRIWVGCSVEATADSRLGNIPGTGPTNTVYPAVIGNCALRYGQIFGTSKRINSRFTLLGRETTAVILDGCFLQSQPGVTLVVRPISAETCPDSPCST